MAAQFDVDQLVQQTRQYEFSDGLRDIQLAILFALGGTAVWLSLEPAWISFVNRIVTSFGSHMVWINLLPVLLAPLAMWGAIHLMNYLRQNWIWRQSGMVKPSRWMVPSRINVLATVILLGGLALGLGLRHWGYIDDVFFLRMLPAAIGWSQGYVLFEFGRYIGLPRYTRLGLAGGLASTALLVLPLAFRLMALVFGLVWALLLTGSGIVTLRSAMTSGKSDQ